jgi:3',5'-cyclic AMP phosphodiesterase CpdA
VKTRTLAHLSDLHLGRSAETDRAAMRVRELLEAGGLDHVIVSGDVTHRGRRDELQRWEAIFGDLQRAGRVSVVPGNHDRLGDDLGARLMRGGRVEAETRDGLYLVRVDSTGPHNKFLLAGHGEICGDVIEQVDLALACAPRRHLIVVTLHHHPVPLPEETFSEKFSALFGWPNAAELPLGHILLERIRGRCDLLLHGHRHVPAWSKPWPHDLRSLALYNAGCTTSLGRFRVFTHCQGQLLFPPMWLDINSMPATQPETLRLAGNGTE